MAKMTPTKKERARIASLLDKWKSRLFLHEWRIELHYDMRQLDGNDNLANCLAEITPNHVYKHATLKLYLEWFRRDAKVQEEALVHELFHCVLKEYENRLAESVRGIFVPLHLQSDLNEKTVQLLTNIAFQDEWRK